MARVPGPGGVLRMQTVYGPYRVFPGRLSVARSFGDIEAKLPAYGGNPKVLTAEPDIQVIDIEDGETDFIFLGCDGIFEKLSSEEAIQCIWKGVREKPRETVHQ